MPGGWNGLAVFILSLSLYFSPSLLTDNFAEYKNRLVAFSLSTYNISLYFLLACVVYYKKSIVILIIVPLQVRQFSPLASFKILSLIFCSLNRMYLSCLVFTELPRFWLDICHEILGSSKSLIRIFSCSVLPLFSFWNSNELHLLTVS